MRAGLLAVLLLAACGPKSVVDGGTVDAGEDAGVQDAGTDAGVDAGADAGVDAGIDAGTDAGPPSFWPLVTYEDGGVLAAPNVIVLAVSGDPNAASFGPWAAWLTDGGFLSTVGGQYGVGAGASSVVNLPSSPALPVWTTTADQNKFIVYLQALFTASAIPANAPNNLYALELPNSWPSRAAYCMKENSFHGYFIDGTQGKVVYLVVVDCTANLQQVEVATSHEIVEAATDPFSTSWQIQDPTEPWTYLGGEIGDMCASFSAPYTEGPYAAQVFWSNADARDAGIPCQPWPSSKPYVTLVGPQTMASAAPGDLATIDVTGWSTADAGSWALYVIDGDYHIDFSTTPQVSAPTIGPGQTVGVQLHVPASASSGQHGAAWVVVYDSVTGEVFGSTMVGVRVQ
jgi:hypothetical protein